MEARVRKVRTNRFVAILLFVSIVSMSFASQAFALRERDMVEKVRVGNKASVLNASWLQIYMRENEYNATQVSNASYYSITSSDDPDFASPVTPIAVQHRFFPEDGPYADAPGAANIAHLNEIYRIFLKLPVSKKMKGDMTYTVTVDPAVVNVGALTTKFDLSVPNEVIHVNQVGYITDGPKIAYLSWWTGQGSISFNDSPSFQVIDEATGKSVYTGNVQFDKAGADEKWGKSDLYSMDFSSVKPEGRYHLYIPGVGSSYSFAISSSVYKTQIGYTLMRGMTLQRDGDAGLNDSDVTHWNRPDAHLDDAIDEATGQRVDLTGGHMDAGDRGKYPYNVASMASSMIATAALFPDQIKAQGESLEIPESGNGIPDYLDELVYELDFLYKVVMNTAKDGAISGYIHPNNDGYEAGQPLTGATDRIYYDVTHGPYKAETLYGAGALASAYNSPMLKQYLPAEKLEGYKAAALRAFQAFETHKDDDSFWKPEDDLYKDTAEMGTPHTWSDEMLIAAANLHHMTGEQKYLDWINSEMSSKPLGSAQKKWGWVNEGPWLDVFMSLYGDVHLSAELRDQARNAILDWADTAMAPSRQQPYGVPMVDDTYSQVGWYFSGSQIGYPMMIAYGISQDEKYRDQLIKTWNYLLGSNPLSNSYISGLGDPQRSPKWLTHEISQYQWMQYKAGNGGWSEMIPGIPNADLQDGKFPSYFNDDWNRERVNKKYPALSDYPALYRYTDTWNTTNEFITVWLTRGASSIVPLIPTELYPLTTTADHGKIDPAGGEYAKGTQLSLSVTPDLGYKFIGWSGDATGADNPVSVTMNAAMQLTANFAPTPTHELATSAEHGKIVLDPPGGVYNEGDTVKVQAVPDIGYRFIGWSGDLSGGDAGAANPAFIAMDGDKTISAQFEVAPTHTLTIEGSGGSVLRSPEKPVYQVGESVTLEAVPDEGYVFDGWSGGLVSTNNPAVVTITKDTTVTANFRQLPRYQLELNETEGGTVTPGSGSYADGTTVTLLASPRNGYVFTGWSGDLAGMTNPVDVTMDRSKTITANFQNKLGIISQDITTILPGKTEVDNGVYTITAAGENIWAAPDAFRYVYEAGLKGSFSIVARLDSMEVGNNNGMAGLMVRTSTENNAAYANIFVQNGQLVSRFRMGGDYSDTKLTQATTLPVWMKITRGVPNPWSIKTYTSNDGVNWTLFTQGDFWGWMDANTPEITAGLFAIGGSPDQWPKYTTAQFSQVEWPRDPSLIDQPVITLDQTDTAVLKEQFTVSGNVTNAQSVKVKVGDGAEQPVAVNEGQFSTSVTLAPGSNTITVTAADGSHDAVPAVIHITYNQPAQTTAYLTQTAPTLDGSIDDSVWKTTITGTVDRSIHDDKLTGDSDNTLRYGLLWDSQYLYVGAEVEDGSVITGMNAFNNDGVEVYVDMGNQKTAAWDNDNSQLAVGPGDTTVTSWRNSAGVITKSNVTSTGYTMEMAIPWSTFGITPNANMKIGFDIGANDDDTGNGRTGVLMWSGTMNNWTDSSGYGEAALSGDTVTDPEPEPEPQSITVDKAVFKNDANEVVSVVPKKGSVKAEVTVTGHGEAQPVTLAFVLYDKKGKAQAVTYATKTVKDKETVTFTASLKLPNSSGMFSAAAYLWNNEQDQQPLADAIVIEASKSK
ncbi:InlB B-repeat-containing protein [Paenibacillus silvisoli]|uniref:InlB B-repeat-containing protein n=1 Tax=Paenibacillus silvisoli TaxID=3110539 RepID=UPI002805F50F|nr:glycoside hydrolase family 9 protein [Paenibacillus silvisoli]